MYPQHLIDLNQLKKHSEKLRGLENIKRTDLSLRIYSRIMNKYGYISPEEFANLKLPIIMGLYAETILDDKQEIENRIVIPQMKQQDGKLQ